MDFSLTDEQKMIQQTVRQFVERELMPLENDVLQNEGKFPNGVEPGVYDSLQRKAKEMGFWGINTPDEYGGANLGSVATCLTLIDLGRTFVPFSFGGAADNILYACNEEQKHRYLLPTIEGTLPVVLRAHRAGSRIGRGQYPYVGGERWSRVGAEWREDLHH